MFFLKKVNAFVLGLAVLLAFGCGGDEEPVPENTPGNNISQTGCRPVTSKHHAVYGEEDREYFYDAAGQVEKVSMAKSSKPSQLLLISYSATGKVTWIRRYNLPAKTLFGKSHFLYNADSLVNKEVLYNAATPGDSTTFMPVSEINYEYDAAKRLIKFSQSPYQSTSVYGYTTFSYGANNTLTEEEFAGSPLMIGWRNEIQYLSNGKAPGNKLAYFNLPPRATTSDEFRFGLLPVTIQSTQFFMGAPASQKTFSYSYVYNTEAYPTEQIMSFPNQQPLTNYWTYNCQ